MNNEGFFLNLGSDDGSQQIRLDDPCVIDCQSEVGLVSLILDKKYPQYLIVHIDHEPRKCIGLAELDLQFTHNEQVKEFLLQVYDSQFFQDIIEEEKRLEQAWNAL